LEKLTDPASPSYVPFPYPKTDYEIIEDFRFAVDNTWGEKSRGKTVILGEDPSKILLKFLGDNPSLKVNQIIKVKDLRATSLSLHYYLLQLEDENGTPVATGIVHDSGLMAGVDFLLTSPNFRPYKTEFQVKEMIRKTIGYSASNDEMERICIFSPICSDSSPLWKIKTPRGVFFIDYFDNVYSIESELPWDMKKYGQPDPSHRSIVILDQLEGKAIFLREITKGGR